MNFNEHRKYVPFGLVRALLRGACSCSVDVVMWYYEKRLYFFRQYKIFNFPNNSIFFLFLTGCFEIRNGLLLLRNYEKPYFSIYENMKPLLYFHNSLNSTAMASNMIILT